MLTWVQPVHLNRQHLEWLAESLHAAPRGARMDHRKLMLDIMTGRLKVFAWEDGLIAVSKVEERLVIFAFCCHNLLKRLPVLVEEVARLAADWQCDTIETMCFDARLSSAMQRLGAQVESTTLVLAVGNEK